MEFYKHLKDSEGFTKLVEDLSCGIIIVMVLVQANITETWKSIVNFKDFNSSENKLAKK